MADNVLKYLRCFLLPLFLLVSVCSFSQDTEINGEQDKKHNHFEENDKTKEFHIDSIKAPVFSDTTKVIKEKKNSSDFKNYLDFYHYLPKETRGCRPNSVASTIMNIERRKYIV